MRSYENRKALRIATVVVLVFLLLASPPAMAWNVPWDGGHLVSRFIDALKDWWKTMWDNHGMGSGGDPVLLESGDFPFSEQDFLIPGRGIPLEMTRCYHSKDNYVGPFGRGWRHNYEISLIRTAEIWGNVSFRVFTVCRNDGIRIAWREFEGPPPDRFLSFTYDIPLTRYTLVGLDLTVYVFNKNGKLISLSDRNGNTTALTYASSGRLEKVTDPAGRTLTFTYGTNKKVASITDPAGRVFQYGYDARNNLAIVTDPILRTTSYEYDAKDRLVSITDAKGTTWLANTYDDQDRVVAQFANGGKYTFSYEGTDEAPIVTVTEPNGSKTRYEMNKQGLVTKKSVDNGGLKLTTTNSYDASFNIVSRTDPEGGKWSYQYDARGNVTQQTDPIGGVTQYFYDTNNVLIKVKDPLGNETTYERDEHSRVARIIGPLQVVVYTFSYSANGDLLGIKDALGNETKNQYDTYGNLTTIINPLGGGSRYEYDIIGNNLSEINENGNKWLYQYDIMGRLIKITSPLGHQTLFEYDENGNRIKETNGLGHSTLYCYDPYDRHIKTVGPNGNEIEYEHDVMGNLILIKNPEQRDTVYTYDAVNRLSSVILSDNGVTLFEYDKVGNVKKVTDALGNVTSFNYDKKSRLLSVVYPDASKDQYAYDNTDAIIQYIARDNRKTQYEHDTYGRLTRVAFADGSQRIYSYDTVGRLLSLTSSESIVSYEYDAVGRVTKTVQNSNPVRYTYDSCGNKIQIMYPDGDFISRYYDQNERLERIADSTDSLIAEYVYDSVNNIISIEYGNGITCSLSYDMNGEMTVLNYSDVISGTSIANMTRTLDKERFMLSMSTARGEVTYSYDSTGRLIITNYPDDYGHNDSSILYDLAGNRTSFQGEKSISYTVNSLNQYTNIGDLICTYDKNGNQISNGQAMFVFNDDKRLVSASLAEEEVGYYKYDGFGRRIERNVRGNITNYIYDGDGILAELAPNGQVLCKYVYGPFTDSIVSAFQGTQRYFYHAGPLGSIAFISDNSGALEEYYWYESWGSFLIEDAQTGSTISSSKLGNRFTFAGREYDSETGLYYLRNRYYDPTQGRFLSPDPLGFWGGINLYAYCFNNPVNFIDPFGLKLKWDDPKVKDALKKLKKNSKAAKELIKKLDDDDEIIRINIANTNEYSTSKNIVSFNPNKKYIYDGKEEWHNRPPEVALAHELIHALHDLNGSLGSTRKIEEQQTVGLDKWAKDKYTENQVRDDYGIVRRPRYGQNVGDW